MYFYFNHCACDRPVVAGYETDDDRVAADRNPFFRTSEKNLGDD